jgi:minichromosome maintenance protein 10
MKATGKQNESEDMSISRDDADSATSTLEAYSGFHLSKRKIDHNTLTRTLQGKSIYSLPRLLKEVKSPDYDPPDCESDYIILGIIASKSTPLDHRTSNPKSIDSAGREENARPKFMVIRLTDLKWELDLFLFDTGFDAFWKLTPGTVVAILNPGIMPPKDRATGAFSLKLSSSEDTVLEIGTSKDLGFCNAIKSNGKECLQWIDGRKTQVCEYHIALKVDKARKGRMQLNTMTNGQGSRDRGSSRGGRGGRGGGRGGLKAEGKQYDSYLHETMYLAPKESGFSATRLLDDRDADVNAWQRGYSREEMQRKRQQARDKEADLAKKLGALGGSAGSEYLKSRADGQARRAAIANPGTQETVTNSGPEPISAESLGLLGKRADDVSLNAVKRKRGPNSGSAPMGWSGAFKTGLPSPIKSARKDPESDQPSPKKKARFMLAEKGIREPGRESLGNIALAPSTDVDYDDDLEIV